MKWPLMPDALWRDKKVSDMTREEILQMAAAIYEEMSAKVDPLVERIQVLQEELNRAAAKFNRER